MKLANIITGTFTKQSIIIGTPKHNKIKSIILKMLYIFLVFVLANCGLDNLFNKISQYKEP